ncbi:33875_t:CDS:2, partial [Racocetra persica]
SMELLDIGRHCAKSDCKQLDYLPIKCQYCKKEFCFNHSKPSEHNCSDAPSGDGERVPICPLCGVPVPIVRGEDPNIKQRVVIHHPQLIHRSHSTHALLVDAKKGLQSV